MTPYEDVPFEGLQDLAPPAPKRPKTAKELDDEENKVYWRAVHTPKRVHCYVCIEMILAGTEVKPARATWSRTQGGVERLYCADHMQQEKAKELLQ